MSEIIEFPKAVKPVTLVGKLLMLNVAIAPKFQCGGFSVTTGRMVSVVTEKTQLYPIQHALDEGILIDVSDNKIVSKGFNMKNSSTSGVMEEDTDKKAFVGKDDRGRMVIVVPKNDEEREQFEAQIAETGSIQFKPSEDEFTGFSPIMEEKLVRED